MYEIGSAALGSNTVTIPLVDIADIINRDGPLSFSLSDGLMRGNINPIKGL